MVTKSKICKQKGVILIADDMFNGTERKVIVQKFTTTYNLSSSCIDKWMKAAKPIVDERRKEEEETKRKLTGETIAGIIKKLGLEKEAILGEYKKVAFFDIRKIYTVDGGLKPINDLDDDSAGAIAGIESFDEKQRDSGEILGTTQKVKISSKVAALDSICKVLGYQAPTKVANTDPDGNDKPAVQIVGMIIQ